MATPRPVGIDLGTTYSAVAWVDSAGRTKMVRSADGEILTPSEVLFQDGKVTVGREAHYATLVEPGRVAQWVKRDMGQKVYARPILGNYLPPEVIQACILRRLKADLVAALGPDVRVVITVPAYFDEPRRKATADAGEMAGLDVLDIVDEPTAAALAFGESVGYLSGSSDTSREMTVLVYDLGGGTFDVTLLQLAPGHVQCLATDGDVQLGGHDWDMRLVEHLARAFKQEHGIDPREDPVGEGRLIESAVEAKHALSARSRTTVHIEHDGQSLDVPISRTEFTDMTADLLERTLCTSRQVLAAAGMPWSCVDRLLLVGGSTRMPMVVEALETLTDRQPDRSVNPDEAVARGAALYARYLLTDETASKTAGFTVTNVNAHSLGIESIDPATLQKTNVILIPRNTPLPASFTKKFTTKSENQRSIVIQVLQGENTDPAECAAIGRTMLADLPEGLPANWPVEVSFEYEANGRLRVYAVVPETEREVTLELERTVGLSDERLGDWRPLISSEAGFDAFDAMLNDTKEDALPAVPSLTSTNPTTVTSTPTRPDETPDMSATTAFDRSSPDEGDRDEPPVTISSGSDATKPPPCWIVWLIMWITSGAAGLAAGYYWLSLRQPDRFPLPWNL
ncbi:MAG: Hsp70 family protein [Pirellulales bacterium]|nr:Hsp70 family protein [Pirellulales bacterium]